MKSPEFHASDPENRDMSSWTDEELKARREKILAELARRRAAEATAKSAPDATPRIPKPEAKKPVTNADVKKSFLSNPTARKALLGVVAAALAVGATIFAVKYATSKNAAEAKANPDPEPTPDASQSVDTTSTHEDEAAGVRYDYSDYRKFDEKSSHNAYGTSRVDCYNNPELTSFEFMKTANDLPEALASFKGAFFEDEQEALGIRDMTENQIDNTISDPNNANATAFQASLLDKLQSIIDDTENTKWGYNLENGTEISHYVIWDDLNDDGVMTPDEMHLGWSKSPRKNAPQANLYRKDKNGNWVKMLDLNLYCDFQPNTATPSSDIPFIPNEETSSPEGPTDETPTEETPASIEAPAASDGTGEPTGDPEGPTGDPEETIEGGSTRVTTPKDPPAPEDPSAPAPRKEPAKKDRDNNSRINENIEKNEERQIHSDDLNTDYTTQEEQKEDSITTQTESSEYHKSIEEDLYPSETTPVQSTPSREAESVTIEHEDDTVTVTNGSETPTSSENVISAENDISEDRSRGANFESSDSYAPVQPDASALEANERAERTNTPEAPASAMPESFTLSDGTEVVIPSNADANLGTGGGYSIDDLLNANFGQ